MPTIHRKRIEGHAVWRADEIGGKRGLSRALAADELDGLDRLARAAAHRRSLEVCPQDFANAALDGLARECRAELARGRGVVIITGLDLARYGVEGFRRLYWWLGQGVGSPVAQSERGDVLGYVRHEKDNPLVRGYTSNLALPFHTDYHEILSLASVSAASAGGESGLVSSLAVHNILLEERPDLLDALYEGWYEGIEAYWFQGPRPKADLPDAKIPYYCEAGGLVSFHSSLFADLAARERGEPIPAVLTEALKAVQDVAARPGVAVRAVLEPGEMAFWHNYTVMHARNRFENEPGHERVLMRLWLNAHEPRATSPAISDCARCVDRALAAMAAQGRRLAKPAVPSGAASPDPLAALAV